MSDGDGGGATPAARKAAPIQVPCLHNPSSHEVAFHLANKQFVWVDLEGPGEDDMSDLAKLLNLHPLTVEDAHTFRQRPKIEDYDTYVFLVVFGVDPDTDSGGRILREVHMIISGDIVVTTHRHPHAGLDELRARYDKQPARSEQFMTYEILDAVISTFIPVLSRIDDDIDDIEERGARAAPRAGPAADLLAQARSRRDAAGDHPDARHVPAPTPITSRNCRDSRPTTSSTSETSTTS